MPADPRAGSRPLAQPAGLVDAALLLLAAVALLGANFWLGRELWAQDEARYGAVLLEMLRDGHWLVPHLDGQPYPDKPPLYFWAAAPFALALGDVALGFQALSLTTTLLALAAAQALGRVLVGHGLATALVFGTMLLPALTGLAVRMDLGLTAACSAAAVAGLRRLDGGGMRELLLFWALTAVAIAIKGPVALLFTALPLVAIAFYEQRRAGLARLKPLAGFAALVGVASTWVGLIGFSGHGEYLAAIWREQLLGRAVDAWIHRAPWYYYLPLLPLALLPWTGYAVAGATDRSARPARLARIALLTGLPLIGLSLLSGKLPIYLAPLLPPLAALAAARLAVTRPAPWSRAVLLAFPWLAAGLIVAAGIHTQSPTHPAAHGLALLGLIMLAALRRPAPDDAARLVAASAGALALGFVALVALLQPRFSPRALGEHIAARLTDGRELIVANTTRGIIAYYAGRVPVTARGAAVDGLVARHPHAVLLLRERDLARAFGGEVRLERCAEARRFELEGKSYRVLVDCR